MCAEKNLRIGNQPDKAPPMRGSTRHTPKRKAPDMEVTEHEELTFDCSQLGAFGKARWDYLRNEKGERQDAALSDGLLLRYLERFDREAEDAFEELVGKLRKTELDPRLREEDFSRYASISQEIIDRARIEILETMVWV